MFARSLKYVAGCEHPAFSALIELVRKKGGSPKGYVIYRYQLLRCCSGHLVHRAEYSQINFSGNEKELAEAAFPYASEYDWEKATHWLYPVAVSGKYRQHPKGAWVKVGRPAPWKRRRRNRRLRLRFGELGHILLAKEYAHRKTLQELYDLGYWKWHLTERMIDDYLFDGESKYLWRDAEMKVLSSQVVVLQAEIRQVKNEARFARQRFFEGRR